MPEPEATTPTLRKRITAAPEQAAPPTTEKQWLDLQQLAHIEISSEDAERAIDFALLPGRDE
jgi:hypothetical protein